MSKRILITGGAGFIGVNACNYFMNKGDSVIVFDNLSRKGTPLNLELLKKHPQSEKLLTVRLSDICKDKEILKQSVAEADAVLHLAAQVAVTTSVINPQEDFEINAYGTFNVLEALRQSTHKPHLIFASTNKVYGGLEHLAFEEKSLRYEFKNRPHGVDEQEPLDFHSPYGCSKGAADQYVRDYHRIYGLKTTVLRQSCIYGRNQFGVEDQGWVAWFIIACLLKKPITIYGTGKQVRDLLFVDDLIELYDRILENPEKSNGEIFNVGGGSQHTLSILELLRNLDQLFFLHYEASYRDWRAGDQPLFISNNSKLKEKLGWEPTINVSKGLQTLVRWAEKNQELIASLFS
jgi:CDP-paratose 2-epimerase